jgi:DNA-binding response OmpR family regulator
LTGDIAALQAKLRQMPAMLISDGYSGRKKAMSGSANALGSLRQGRGERILVVDDSREMVRHLSDYLLPMFGFDASYARDGETALHKIREERPDLVLLDLNLPEMTGLDILHALAEDSYRPPVVLMTGSGSEQSAVEAFRLGVKDYLVKPFTLDEVFETIQRGLARRSETESAETADETMVRVLQHEVQSQRARFSRMLQTARSLIPNLPEQKIIERALQIALQETGAEQAQLWFPASGSSAMRLFEVESGSRFVNSLLVVTPGSVVQQVLESGHPVRQANFSEGVAFGAARRARALLAMPLWLHQQIAGVLLVANYALPHAFSEEHQLTLRTITDFVGLALENAQVARKSADRHTAQLHVARRLNQLTRTLVTHPPSETIREILDSVRQSWQLVACSCWQVDQGTGESRFVAHAGEGSSLLSQTVLPPGKGFVGYVARTGKWIFSNAVKNHPHHYPGIDQATGFRTQSLLCVPVVFQGRTIGVLELVNRLQGEFSEKDVAEALDIAMLLALALQLEDVTRPVSAGIPDG